MHSWHQLRASFAAARPIDTIRLLSGPGYMDSIYETTITDPGEWYLDGVATGDTDTQFLMTSINEGKALTFRTASYISNVIEMFIPTDISGVVAEFDASRSDKMTLVSGAVSNWLSNTGSLELVQATALNRPTFSATGRNSRPAVAGNGSNQWMTLNTPSALPNGANPSTMAAVAYRPNSVVGGFNGVFVYGDSGVNTARQLSKIGGPDRAGASLGSAGSHCFPVAAPNWLGVDKIDIGTFAPTQINAWVDGQYNQAATITLNTPVPTIAQLFRFTNNGGYWDGSVQDLIFFNSVLSTLDRQKVEGYLAHKWGVAALLPVSHPYKTVAPRKT